MFKINKGEFKENKVLFVKPPDRFLENEFTYQQLGAHYLQSFLAEKGIQSDQLVLYEPSEVRKQRELGELTEINLEQLRMLFVGESEHYDKPFDKKIFENYTTIGLSVMTPQAPDAYLLSKLLNKEYPNLTTIIGGSHPRYYFGSVANLPEEIAFDFVVPQDGWIPMYDVASGAVKKGKKSQVLNGSLPLKDLPPPSRPVELMKKYNFSIAGVPAFHTITALGCPFTCHFCESGSEKLRKFSDEMINRDLETMAIAHKNLGHEKAAVMIFDDVGLMSPTQVEGLSKLIKNNGFTTWRAFTHAYMVVKHKEKLLGPFYQTGGRRIGMGLETGSQKSLDLINKRNGQPQKVGDHYDSVVIANELGIAVDAFTMIYPWEDENDLIETTKMVEFIANNPVKGFDNLGRQLKNHVDSTIMAPYEGTKFNEIITLGQLPGVKIKPNIDPGLLFYKGLKGGSGWPYKETRLPKERYEEEQALRNSFRPKYR